MIHHRLKTYLEIQALSTHPDEDTICAFVEGRLEEAGSSQMVSHLIACGLCRHTTAQLGRLDSQINAANDSPLEDESSGRVRLLLEGLASRVIPSSEEDVVFAYQNPAELNTQANEPAPDEPDQTQSSAGPSSHVKETEPD
jgi:anti-sigma factor ChrR (cupin superfamily)